MFERMTIFDLAKARVQFHKKISMNNRKLLTYIIGLLIVASCESQPEEYVEYTGEEDSLFVVNNYEKSEHTIEMRDGIKLFTTIYTPADKSQKYPIILYRTPYSCAPYGTEKENYKIDLGPNPLFPRDKYIFVYQDVRGKFMSEGEFVNMTPHQGLKKNGKPINESTDTFDTIEWLLFNATGNNGKVGQWGISYPGFYTTAGMIDSHPALVAASPQAPIADWFFDDFHHHGAFFLPHTFNFYTVFGQPKHGPIKTWPERFDHGTDDGYDFFIEMEPLYKANQNFLGDSIDFWNKIIQHPNYDKFWQDRNILPHLNNINCAVLTVGGWYDAEDLYGPLNIYKNIEENNPQIFNALVMGPWSHGGWRRTTGEYLGDVNFGTKTSDFYNNEIIYPFFSYHLKGKGGLELPEAYMFETGTNQWRTFDVWPPENVKYRNLYFKQKSALSYVPPRENEYGMDIFESDPANPIRFTEAETTGMPKTYMTENQDFNMDNEEVVYYQTEPLDKDLTLAGSLIANLEVSTDQGDADWIVKLIDVYPANHPAAAHQPTTSLSNYQQMVRSEVLRGRFRNSYENPEAFVSNEITTVKVPLQDVLHTFKKGHRLMIQIQSSWFPIVDINPQKYVENIFEAQEEDFVKAKHRISRSGKKPSFIKIGVLEKES